MKIILGFILGFLIAGIIAFSIWFMARTPEHLRGYYAIPVNILVGVITLVLVGIGVIGIIDLF